MSATLNGPILLIAYNDNGETHGLYSPHDMGCFTRIGAILGNLGIGPDDFSIWLESDERAVVGIMFKDDVSAAHVKLSGLLSVISLDELHARELDALENMQRARRARREGHL